MNRFLVIFALISLFLSANAQYINLHYHGFLDNREYFNEYTTPQTIFGNRLAASIGLKIDSLNYVYGGGSYTYEFGSKGDLIAPDITLFYKYNSKPLKLYFGAFPRYKLINHPRVLMSDTLQYYRPNVEGVFVEASGKFFKINTWIDWLSRQTYEKKEIFLAGLSGEIKFRVLYIDMYAVMQHIASTANKDIEYHLRDNGGGVFRIGANLSPYIFLDELKLSAGVVANYDQLRGIYDLTYHYGFLGNVIANFKGYGFECTVYNGDGQELVIGDGFYKAKNYVRLDAFATPYKKGNLFVKAYIGFHFFEGDIDYTQELKVIYNFNDKKLKGLKNNKRNN